MMQIIKDRNKLKAEDNRLSTGIEPLLLSLLAFFFTPVAQFGRAEYSKCFGWWVRVLPGVLKHNES